MLNRMTPSHISNLYCNHGALLYVATKKKQEEEIASII